MKARFLEGSLSGTYNSSDTGHFLASSAQKRLVYQHIKFSYMLLYGVSVVDEVTNIGAPMVNRSAEVGSEVILRVLREYVMVVNIWTLLTSNNLLMYLKSFRKYMERSLPNLFYQVLRPAFEWHILEQDQLIISSGHDENRELDTFDEIHILWSFGIP